MSTGNPIQGGPESSRRRSQRVILSLPISVRTEGGPQSASFEEKTHTLVVNAHGALIALAGKVNKGQRLRLINVSTQAEELCRVVHLGSPAGDKIQVGVEFLKPSPDFWHIAFPPEDWTIPRPEPATADPS
ncbi:MAG TPA: PilZ domain-containing protein [Candidatus Acidoferrales bacterium]|nr:PilZ domain-containing protein [Candidatus Acidoferrales bacterium]